MDATYLVGMFVPKGIKDGEKVDIDRHVAIKVTVLQKEVLKASPASRRSFIDSVFENLRQDYPDVADRFKRTHDLWVIDPEQRLGKRFEPTIRHWEQHGCHDHPVIDLTEFTVMRRH